MLRLPSELAADFRRVDRVPAIVPWPIAHERLEPAIAWRRPRRALQGGVGRGRTNALDRVTEPVDDLEVGPLVAAADIVFFARTPLVEHQQQTRAVILDVQPVADVRAVAVDRQWPAVDRVQDDERNQLLGKLIRPVVVRAVRDQRREAVGVEICPHQVVRRRLARGVG